MEKEGRKQNTSWKGKRGEEDKSWREKLRYLSDCGKLEEVSWVPPLLSGLCHLPHLLTCLKMFLSMSCNKLSLFLSLSMPDVLPSVGCFLTKTGKGWREPASHPATNVRILSVCKMSLSIVSTHFKSFNFRRKNWNISMETYHKLLKTIFP